MISERLLTIVRCPDCGGTLTRTATSGAGDLRCQKCGREYPARDRGFIDLRTSDAFAEQTKYLDEALHADSRHETVSPPLLSAAIRNDMLRDFLAPTASDRVIDLGCGSGRALVWNRDSGAYMVGVDVSAHFASQARADIDLVIGDLRRLPVADSTFTKAFSLDVAEHLSRESLTAMLGEAARVLAPGGELFVYTHVRKTSPLSVWPRMVNRVAHGLHRLGLIDLSQEWLRKSDHLNPMADIPDFQRIASGAGFRLARIRYYTPIVGSVVENLVIRLAEGALSKRAAKRLGRTEGVAEPLRAARLEAKRRIARGGPTYLALRMLTALMKLDVLLFGRIRSGPFFALLVNEKS